MFEQKLSEMTAFIFIEPKTYQALTASNVGLDPNLVSPGWDTYSFDRALSVIKYLDRLLVSAPKRLQKTIKAERMSFVLAFGPDMEEFLRGGSCHAKA